MPFGRYRQEREKVGRAAGLAPRNDRIPGRHALTLPRFRIFSISFLFCFSLLCRLMRSGSLSRYGERKLCEYDWEWNSSMTIMLLYEQLLGAGGYGYYCSGVVLSSLRSLRWRQDCSAFLRITRLFQVVIFDMVLCLGRWRIQGKVLMYNTYGVSDRMLLCSRNGDREWNRNGVLILEFVNSSEFPEV